MADTLKQTSELRFEALFVDGDTRAFSIKDPRPTVAQSDIASLNAFMQENGILIGDKYGGRFGRITDARKVNKSTYNLDLE